MINYQINFNPNGGDLGRAALGHITPLEFQIVLPHVAHILECLYMAANSRLPFCYAFEFSAFHKDLITLAIMQAQLPQHVKFYETDGKKLFEMRGTSGGITSGLICYLITEE